MLNEARGEVAIYCRFSCKKNHSFCARGGYESIPWCDKPFKDKKIELSKLSFCAFSDHEFEFDFGLGSEDSLTVPMRAFLKKNLSKVFLRVHEISLLSTWNSTQLKSKKVQRKILVSSKFSPRISIYEYRKVFCSIESFSMTGCFQKCISLFPPHRHTIE